MKAERYLEICKRFGWTAKVSFSSTGIDINLTKEGCRPYVFYVNNCGSWWLFSITFSSLATESGKENPEAWFEWCLKHRTC